MGGNAFRAGSFGNFVILTLSGLRAIGPMGPFHKTYVTLRERNYQGDHRYSVAMVVPARNITFTM